MQINVTLIGSLRDKLPKASKGRTTLTLAADATVADAIALLGLAGNVAAGIGGVAVELTHRLQPNDEIQIFRQLGGG